MINLIPETYTAPASARRRYVWRSLAMVAALLAVFVVFFALTAARPDLAGLNLAMVVICAIFMAAATYEFVVLMRSLDELQQRVHVTSLAIGGSALGPYQPLSGLPSSARASARRREARPGAATRQPRLPCWSWRWYPRRSPKTRCRSPGGGWAHGRIAWERQARALCKFRKTRTRHTRLKIAGIEQDDDGILTPNFKISNRPLI